MLKRFLSRRTQDKEAADVHVVSQLGPTQSLTPEGFLLCQDVPVARTGTMVYGPNETPIKVGTQGVARVTRDAATLFSPVTIASAQGKPIVNEHPDEDVTPTNWRALSVGIMLNPRQGTDDAADVMLADFLVTDRATIRDVQAGKREVSLGYEADYKQTGEGEGRQTNIIVNHVALVDRGRCGPRCAIGDNATTSLKENTMGNKTRHRISDGALGAVRRIFRDAEQELDQLGTSGLEGEGMGGPGDDDPDGDGPDSHIHIHMHPDGTAAAGAPPEAGPPAGEEGMEGVHTEDDPVEARFQAIEQTLQQIMGMLQGGGGGEQPPADDGGELPPDDGEGGPPADDMGGGDDLGGEEEPPTRDRALVGDSAPLERGFRELLSDAEILVPGFRLPTFDSRAARKITVDSMCRLRRSVLDHLGSTAHGSKIIENLLPSGRTIDKMSCSEAAVIFKSAAGAQRIINTRQATADSGHLPNTSIKQSGAPRTLAELNAFNRQYYAAGKKK